MSQPNPGLESLISRYWTLEVSVDNNLQKTASRSKWL